MNKSKSKKLNLILCGTITRALRNVRNLKGKAFVVGGIVTEGATLRDVDIVITEVSDIKKLQKALGKLASRTHFMLQKGAPPAPIFIVITGNEPKSMEVFKPKKGQKIRPFEYAGPSK